MFHKTPARWSPNKLKPFRGGWPVLWPFLDSKIRVAYPWTCAASQILDWTRHTPRLPWTNIKIASDMLPSRYSLTARSKKRPWILLPCRMPKGGLQNTRPTHLLSVESPSCNSVKKIPALTVSCASASEQGSRLITPPRSALTSSKIAGGVNQEQVSEEKNTCVWRSDLCCVTAFKSPSPLCIVCTR